MPPSCGLIFVGKSNQISERVTFCKRQTMRFKIKSFLTWNAEAYLGPCQTTMVELWRKYLTVVSIFCKGCFIIGFWQSRKYAPVIKWNRNWNKTFRSQHLLVQSQQQKYQNNVWNLFKINKDTRTTSLTLLSFKTAKN